MQSRKLVSKQEVPWKYVKAQVNKLGRFTVSFTVSVEDGFGGYKRALSLEEFLWIFEDNVNDDSLPNPIVTRSTYIGAVGIGASYGFHMEFDG